MALTDTDINLIDTLAAKSAESGISLLSDYPQIRDESLNALKERGLPGNKHEEYKYFNVSRKIQRDYNFPLPAREVVESGWIRSKLVEDNAGIHIVFINGIYSEEFSNFNSSIDGFEFYLPGDSGQGLNNIVDAYAAEKQNINKDPYLDLNRSFPNGGFAIRINQKFDPRPVYIYHIINSGVRDLLVNHLGIILVEKDTKADISEIFISENEDHHFRNHNTELIARNGAFVNYHLIQETGSDSVNIQNTNIYQSANSRVNTYTFSLSGKDLRNNLNILLNEEDCESHLYGLYFISNNDHIDNHTTVDHRKPHCYSNEYYKGIIDEKGMGTFNGKIFVRPNAQKTNAFQSNKNLVLTDTATINTKPQLEIWADDVKCSHGATTGQIDEEQMFYLRSRGLSEKSAAALLLHAFAFDIIDRIELKHLSNYIGSKINNRLGYQFSD
ncbi:MAG: Fe-S cluster assembly protein SufD [Cyclobacteriaceae bacterium]|jgi:Fe-S cluster assembly protein SufD